MKQFKVLITSHSFGKEGREAFGILEKANIIPVLKQKNEIWNEDELCKIITDMDGIIVGADKVTKKVLERANKLKIIAKHGIGVDNIDVEEATKRGIPVAVAMGSNTVAVAELAVGLIFNLARNINICSSETKDGRWKRRIGVELKGKTAGIIGLGRIGKETAKRLHFMGMNLLAYDQFEDKEFAKAYKVKYVSLEYLLKNSDFISLHVPLTSKTRYIINKDNIDLIKSSAYIINTARGGLIEETALYEALKENRIAGAAVDTFESEPPIGSPLLSLPNVIATPHIGAYTHQSINNMSMLSAKAVVDFAAGKKPEFVINKEVYSKGGDPQFNE